MTTLPAAEPAVIPISVRNSRVESWAASIPTSVADLVAQLFAG